MRQPIWISLRRFTSSGRYIPEIDGLRFVAIASVLLYHLGMMSMIGCGVCIPIPPETIGRSMLFHVERGVSIFLRSAA